MSMSLQFRSDEWLTNAYELFSHSIENKHLYSKDLFVRVQKALEAVNEERLRRHKMRLERTLNDLDFGSEVSEK